MSVDFSELSTWANLCAILTFVLAVFAWVNFKWGEWSQRSRLKDHLRRELEADKPKGKKGQRTLLHIVRYVGLTENEILRASFKCKQIERVVAIDKETGKAKELLFQFKP